MFKGLSPIYQGLISNSLFSSAVLDKHILQVSILV
jgi:hypothetical protein